MVKKRLQMKGNSLIELMVVITVLAIIALLASPNLKRFAVKSRRAEAIQGVGFIYALQQAYREDNGRYGQLLSYGQSDCPAALNEINFEMSDCKKLRYQYYTTTNTQTLFEALAVSSIVCSNGSPDLVSVDFNKAIAVTDCQTFTP